MSDYVFLGLFLFIIVLGLFNKVNCFDSFIQGSKSGIKTCINMFSHLLVFMLAISLLISSGLISFLEEVFNFKYSLLLVQMFIRPISASSSLTIMMEIYDGYGVDSLYGILSSMIHYISDATLYLVPFYCGIYSIKNYDRIIIIGLIVNIFSYLIAIGIVSIFFIF